MDRPDSMGLEQFTSRTLEACDPKPCYWNDAAAPAGYVTLMMMIMKVPKENFEHYCGNMEFQQIVPKH